MDDYIIYKDDREINEVIKWYFGDVVFILNDLDVKFVGRWLSIKEMCWINKMVIFVDLNCSYVSEYFYRFFWIDGFLVNGFVFYFKMCLVNSENIF